MSQGGLPRLWGGHASTAAGRSAGGLWTATDGSDRLPDDLLPHAAAGGGGVSGTRPGHLDESGQHPKVLGAGQRRSGPALSGVGTATEKRAGIERVWLLWNDAEVTANQEYRV